MRIADSFVRASSERRADEAAFAHSREIEHLMRERETGTLALARSLAEHPELGLGGLVQLANWRLEHGLDRPGLTDSSGRRCTGCLVLLDVETLPVPWRRSTEDPESGETLVEAVTPRLRPECASAAVLLPTPASSGNDAPARLWCHPSMVSDLDPETPVRTLPLLDPDDVRALDRFVDASSAFDLTSLDPICDWALSARYGLAGDDRDMCALLAETGALSMAAEELSRRVDAASARLRDIVRRLDLAVGAKPTALAVPRRHRQPEAEGRKAVLSLEGVLGGRDSALSSSNEARAHAGAPAAGEGGQGPVAGRPQAPVAASSSELFGQVDASLERAEKRPRGLFGR